MCPCDRPVHHETETFPCDNFVDSRFLLWRVTQATKDNSINSHILKFSTFECSYCGFTLWMPNAALCFDMALNDFGPPPVADVALTTAPECWSPGSPNKQFLTLVPANARDIPQVVHATPGQTETGPLRKNSSTKVCR